MNGLWPMAVSFETLIFLLFLIISVVGSLANKWRQMQEEAARRNRPRPAPRPSQRPLNDEIAEFLRTAGERRGKPGAPPNGGSASAPPRPAAPSRPAATPRPVQRPPRPPVEQPLEVRPLETRPAPLGEPFGTRSLAGDLGQLKTEVSQETARLNDPLRQAFSHQLTTLSPKDTPAPTSPSASSLPAAPIGLAALLTSGEGLRNAVILNEILTRPEHRWE